MEKVQKEIFGKQYKAKMTMGWNVGLTELTNSANNNAMEQKKGRVVDFSFQEKRPTTQGDIKTILFGDTVTKMIKCGNFGRADGASVQMGILPDNGRILVK